MDQYVFSKDVNQAIVDGVLQGYKSYLDERRAKKDRATCEWCIRLGKRESY